MAALPPPVTLPSRLPPDRDFDALRAEAIDVVAADSGPTWTDHNLSDPGITMLEVLAWGLADLHYRTANRGFELAPLEVPLWLDLSERDWYGIPDLDDPARVVALASVLAWRGSSGTGPPEVQRMAEIIAGADSRRAAITALVDESFGDPARPLTWDEAAVVVALIRASRVRRAALDHSSTLAAAWTEARRNVERRAPADPIDEAKVDVEILRLLGFESGLAGLWEDELRTLIRRQRHRLFVERVAGILPLPPGSTVDGLKAQLGIDEAEARAVLALHPCPPDTLPETWEAEDGWTVTWPPHPLQAMTTEPVTSEDYAARARSAPRVRRAWTFRGALAGLGWDGTVRASSAPNRGGAVTVLVEFESAPANPAEQRAWLREVLAFLTAAPDEASEVEAPFDTLTTPDRHAPRRVICDELGVALVQRCPVTLNGVLHVALGADRDEVLCAALLRVAAFFAAGRPESATAAAAGRGCPGGIEGPWPPAPQPESGWTPGEALRLHEIVQVLADDPTVIGVEGVEVQIDGQWHAVADGATQAPLAPDCVPVLAGPPVEADCVPGLIDAHCLQVRLELGADCHG